MLIGKRSISSEDILFVVVLIVGCILRFYNYANWSLSNDELSALARLHYSSFSEMINLGVKENDMHPAGVQTFLWTLTHLFGNSVAVVRLPFVILGCLSIPLVYLISKHWFNKNVALFSMALFSVLQFPILYSQLARPYSPGLFFSLLAVYCVTKIVQQANTTNAKAGFSLYHLLFTLSGVICMYTHYFCFLFIAIVGISGFFFMSRKYYLAYFISGALMFIFYVPSYSIFIHHFSIGGLGGEQGWLGPPKSTAMFAYLYYSLNGSLLLVIMALVSIALPLYFSSASRKLTSYQKLSLIFASILVLIAYFYSIYKNPVFQYSILIFGFPYFLMFIFSFSPEKLNTKYVTAITIVILCCGLFSTVAEKKFYSTRSFAVFKEVAEQTVSMQNRYGENNVEKIISVISPFYINYYLPTDSSITYSSYHIYTTEDRMEVKNLISQSKKKFFLTAWSNSFNDPAVHFMIRQKFPYVKEFHQYFNSGIYLYSKDSSSTLQNIPTKLFSYATDFEGELSNIDTSLIREVEFAHSGSKVSILDSLHEYSTTFKFPISKMKIAKGTTLEFSVWVKSSDFKEAQLIFSVGNYNANNVWRSVHIDEQCTANDEWQQCFIAYTITEEITDGLMFAAYVNNPQHKFILLDDFNINVVEYPSVLE